MAAPPFDRIVVRSADGERSYSLPEFLELPLHVRIGHILARELAFFRGGASIELGEALRLLREMPLDEPRKR
jgi:hypothetical protein